MFKTYKQSVGTGDTPFTIQAFYEGSSPITTNYVRFTFEAKGSIAATINIAMKLDWSKPSFEFDNKWVVQGTQLKMVVDYTLAAAEGAQLQIVPYVTTPGDADFINVYASGQNITEMHGTAHF